MQVRGQDPAAPASEPLVCCPGRGTPCLPFRLKTWGDQPRGSLSRENESTQSTGLSERSNPGEAPVVLNGPTASRLPDLWPWVRSPPAGRPWSANTTQVSKQDGGEPGWHQGVEGPRSHRHLPPPRTGRRSAQMPALHSRGGVGAANKGTSRRGSLGPLPTASRHSLWPALQFCVASKGGRRPRP